MKLKEFIERFRREKGRNDYLRLYYEGPRGRQETIELSRLGPEQIELNEIKLREGERIYLEITRAELEESAQIIQRRARKCKNA